MLKTNNTNTKQKGEIKMKKCGICWNEFEGIGNNPHPIQTKNNFLCCDVCNANIVIPSRKSIEDAKEQLKIKKHERFVKQLDKLFIIEIDYLLDNISKETNLSQTDRNYLKQRLRSLIPSRDCHEEIKTLSFVRSMIQEGLLYVAPNFYDFDTNELENIKDNIYDDTYSRENVLVS